ncbi:MAG: hypothetical protein J5998_03535 [Clostridia bacterium]|nr:hypothetical protein [Clostridia bacterium]
MTSKQSAFARLLANGMGLEKAASMAGYNLGYARKKSREPAFLALVERLKAKEAKACEDRDAVERLWQIINDETTTPQERTNAIRALIAYDRAHANDQRTAAPVKIIDDLPPMCENCPNAVTFSEGGANIGPDRDQGPGGDDREGCPEASGTAPDAAAPQG